ncbi:MAG: histidinol-phosphatase HisJ family protein [Lachnospiraceae bacterium]|nr:histidinol-phosphatase HisJ family protein [Lachnospiraceae bacterium]
MLTDNHTHTCFSGDSDAPVRAQIEAAISKGLGGITFTDHCDPDFPVEPDMFSLDFENYFKQMRTVREEYAGKIDVQIGLELGMRTDQEELLNSIASSHPFDFIIGSIHVVDGYDPYYKEYWQDKGAYEGLYRYFQSAIDCLKMYDFYDTFGHLDYIFRYVPEEENHYTWLDFKDQIDEILRIIIERGKCLEINTAGLKYGLGYAHPHPDILKRYAELGGSRITLGSDAHAPEHIGYGFKETAKVLKECGFTNYIRFENRREVTYKL